LEKTINGKNKANLKSTNNDKLPENVQDRKNIKQKTNGKLKFRNGKRN